MKYALVQNNEIKVGPRDWRFSTFASYVKNELAGEDVDLIPVTKTDDVVVQGNQFKILPVLEPTYPSNINSKYEQLAGPFWTINENNITGYFDKAPKELSAVKNELKSIVASNRYKVENGGTTITINGQELKVETNRDVRDTFFMAANLIQEGQTYTFKFPLSGNVFVPLTRADLLNIVGSVAMHVQLAFEWEGLTNATIDAAANSAELDVVELRHPSQILEETNLV